MIPRGRYLSNPKYISIQKCPQMHAGQNIQMKMTRNDISMLTPIQTLHGLRQQINRHARICILDHCNALVNCTCELLLYYSCLGDS